MDKSLNSMKQNETLQELIAAAFSLPEGKEGEWSALSLAFLGDAVYEVVIRTMVVKGIGGRPKDLNRAAIRYVSAKAQSEAMTRMEPYLTEEEAGVYRRGRNANPSTMAKNASVADYRRATGLEALIGYLYLKGENERLVELIRIGAQSLQE